MPLSDPKSRSAMAFIQALINLVVVVLIGLTIRMLLVGPRVDWRWLIHDLTAVPIGLQCALVVLRFMQLRSSRRGDDGK